MTFRTFLKNPVNYLNDLIAQTFGQGGLLGPLRGPSTLTWLIRVWALFWTTIQFSNHWINYGETVQSLVRTTLLIFFGYVILSFFGEIYFPKLLSSEWARTFRVCFEIAAYSVFYFVSGDYHSEFYLLYLPPLIVAIRYLDLRRALFGLALALVSFHLLFTQLAPSQWTFTVWQSYIVRQSILLGIGLFYSSYRYRTIIGDVQKERSSLLNAFKVFNKGMYVVDQQGRLLFVNETLLGKQGPYYVGQPCASYFGCPENLCDLRPTEAVNNRGNDAQKNCGLFSDQDGHPYQVEIFKCPLTSDNGELLGNIAIVTDLKNEKLAESRLGEYTRLIERRVEALAMERNRILTTITDLGPILAGTGELKNIMKIVSTVAKESLNAETAQLFLLEDNQLVRKAIDGFPDDWFVEERYPAGVGITWQAMVAREGEKYGRPVRVDDVENDPRVVQRHLSKYKEKSAYRQIKSLMVVPINGWERTFGALRVVNKVDDKGNLSIGGFSKEDEDFIVSIASMASLSIENQNTSLFQEATRHLQDSKTLFTVSQHITEARSESEILQVIVDEARHTIPSADKAIIHLIDYQHKTLVPKASSPNNNNGDYPQFGLNEGIVGKVVRFRQSVYVADTHKDRDFVPRGSKYRSLLVVPLMIRNNVIGTISIASSLENAFVSQENEQLLTALAAQTAIVIEKAKFLDVVRILNSNLGSMQQVLPAIFEALRLVGYDSASLQIIRDNRLRIIDCDGFQDPGRIKEITFPIDDPKYPNWKVVQSGQPFIVDDVRLRYPHFVEKAEKYHSSEIRSWLGIPLVDNEGNVIGMFALDKHEPDYYTSAHSISAMAFANHMAIALGNSKLFNQVLQKRDELKKLYRISQTLSSSLDYQETLRNIVSTASRLFRSKYSGIVLVDESLSVIGSIEDLKVGKPLHERIRPEGVTKRILMGYKPVFEDNLRPDDETHNPLIRKKGFRSYAGLPIIVHGKIRGILYVHSYKAGTFKGQRRLLQIFCNHAAVAIEKYDLHLDEENRKTMLSKFSRAQSELIGISNPDQLYRTCASIGVDVFDVEDCSLYIVDKQKSVVTLVASTKIPEHLWQKQDVYLGEKGLTASVIRKGRPLNLGGGEIENNAEWSGKFQEHLPFLPSKRCHSLLILPLRDKKGEKTGALKLENRLGFHAEKRFPDFEVNLLQTFASSVGLAIEVAKSFQQEVEKEAKLQAYDRLSRELHDIKNVLGGAVVLESDNAIKSLKQKNYNEVKNRLEIISKGGQHVHDELYYLRLGLTNPNLSSEGPISSLEKFAKEVLYLRCNSNKRVIRTIRSDIEIGLYKIGRAAIDNIKRHAKVDEFRLELNENNGILEFSICDNGVGFDAKTVVKQATSFGLQNMQWLARKIGGTCEINSWPNQGTRVVVRVRLEE